MKHSINTGIIGFGLSGKIFHAPFIHTHPGFNLTSVVERHSQKSKEIYPYVSVLKNYEDLLQDESIELVVVATPNIYHFPIGRDCLLAGKHVIIEKPFTPKASDADELIHIAGRADKNIFVYQNRRWDADFLTIRKLIEDGSLGKIKYYEAHFDRFNPTLKPGSWRDEDAPGGGILYDLGSHLIDQALFLFGMPEKLKADIGVERPGGVVDDNFTLKLYYPKKTIVLKAGMMVKKPGPRYTIDGSSARFTKHGIDPQEALLKAGEMPGLKDWCTEHEKFWGIIEHLPAGRKKERVVSEKGNYMCFYDNVFNVLVHKKPMLVKPQEARDVIFIIEKAFESNMMNKTIKLINKQ